MAQIRQEINILNELLAIGTANTDTNARVQLDTTQYNGTVTYYFEVLVNGSASNTGSVTLRRHGTSTDDATISVGTDTNYTLKRSTAFTPPAGQTVYFVNGAGDGVHFQNIKAARIVIIQNATTLTSTETQIEIGSAANTTTTTNTALTNPKYWKYDASKWNGTLTVYFESTFKSGTSKSAATMTLQTSTDILAPTWSDVASSDITTTGTVATRVRSGAITLTDGNWYRAVMKAGNSKSGITTYNAKIVVKQMDGSSPTFDTDGAEIHGGTGGSGELLQAIGQSFKILTTSTITGVKLRLKKTGTPTSTLNIDIVSSLTGGSLANATQSESALTTTMTEYEYTFGSPVSLTGGSTYYIRLTRSPDTYDATNFINVSRDNGASYSDGTGQRRTNNAWDVLSVDLTFTLIGQAGFTKLEPQYLLANSLFAAGTGLQTFLTDWDSTEWTGVTNTYTFTAWAANGSTSDVTLEEADGGGTVTNSTLTNIDNGQISAAMTMPTDQNLDTKATTNAGDVAGCAILVGVTVDAASGVTGPGHEYTIITS